MNRSWIGDGQSLNGFLALANRRSSGCVEADSFLFPNIHLLISSGIAKHVTPASTEEAEHRQGVFVNFGEKVKQLRAERNLTQPQLALAIGIEQSYLSKLENDKSVPSADIFQAILRAFSVDVATFLDGVDDKVVHRDLRQVPEVANHLNAQVNRRVHSIKAWLFASAISCTLGLTLAVAGYRGLLYSNAQYSYISKGVVLAGEPSDVFDNYDQLIRARLNAGMINETQAKLLFEQYARRADQGSLVLDEYRGEKFVQKVSGGQRSYDLQRESVSERRESRWLQFVGALLTFAGILGFVVEARLRSVRF
jgi:transcriptional regulator with XRE-family HTH domain